MLATGLGHRESALAAIEEATAIRRKLADARPGVFLHRCAASLDNLATGFRRWGRGLRQRRHSQKPRELLNGLEHLPGAD